MKGVGRARLGKPWRCMTSPQRRPAVFHLDQDLLGPWLWLRGISESEVVDLAVVVDEERLHGIPPCVIAARG